MYFSLPQLFVFLFNVLRLSVAVFVIRDRFVKKKADLCLNLYPCVTKYSLLFLLLSLSLSLSLSGGLAISGLVRTDLDKCTHQDAEKQRNNDTRTLSLSVFS